MRTKFLLDVLNLDEYRRRRGLAEQYRPPGGQAGKLAQERAESVWHKSLHQLLVAIVDEPVKEKRVALGEDGRRHLRRSLRRQDESQSEFPPFACDAFEHPRALAGRRRCGFAPQVAMNERVRFSPAPEW